MKWYAPSSIGTQLNTGWAAITRLYIGYTPVTAFPQTTRSAGVEGETKQKKLLPLLGFCFESVGSLIHRKVQSERLLSGGIPR